MRRTSATFAFALSTLLTVATNSTAQDAPRVTVLAPRDGACDVDSTAMKELTITFDRDMDTSGNSLCGGGTSFPRIEGQPHWKDKRSFVVDVVLAPDRDYRLGVNCQGALNFRSATGTPLEPLSWSFTTLPEKLPDLVLQRARNEAATTRLIRAIDEHDAHRDLRVLDWAALWREAMPFLLEAPTDVAFAARAAQVLEPTEDLHLWLRLGPRSFAVGRRAVDSLYRFPLIGKHFTIRALGRNAAIGRTDDDIGYLMVGAWTRDVDLDAVETALRSILDTKAIVIDARPNSGGEELLARRIAAWFVEGEKVYAKHRTKDPDAESGFGPEIARVVTGNPDPGRRYAGPIAVLTSGHVMSSNESFVLMLKQAPDCTVVGQHTAGSSGNPQPIELGNGVTVMVPSWQALFPDGSDFEGRGIAPDVEVEATLADFATRDPILERALALLRHRAAR